MAGAGRWASAIPKRCYLHVLCWGSWVSPCRPLPGGTHRRTDQFSGGCASSATLSQRHLFCMGHPFASFCMMQLYTTLPLSQVQVKDVFVYPALHGGFIEKRGNATYVSNSCDEFFGFCGRFRPASGLRRVRHEMGLTNLTPHESHHCTLHKMHLHPHSGTFLCLRVDRRAPTR